MNLLLIIPIIAKLLTSSIASNNTDQTTTNFSTKLIDCYGCDILVSNITNFDSQFKRFCKPNIDICENNTCGYIKYKPNKDNSFKLSLGCEYDEIIKNAQY